MQKEKETYYRIKEVQINNKKYLIPHHNLQGKQKYFERKIPSQVQGYKQRKFYDKDELKSMESKLTCGINKKDFRKESKQKIEEIIEEKTQQKVEEIKQVKIQRPILPSEGITHFINIPVFNQLKEVYQNAIKPTIQEQILPLLSLHVNLLGFRLHKQADLDQWANILKDIKKKKINIKGIGMVGQKNQYARRIYLNVDGIDDIIDTIVGKAIDRNLIKQNELVNIRFDKKTQSYKSQKSYVSILKTKGKDLVDAKEYLAAFKNLSFTGLNVNQFRISVVKSFKDDKGFYDDRVVNV